jgi:hypothetical protein
MRPLVQPRIMNEEPGVQRLGRLAHLDGVLEGLAGALRLAVPERERPKVIRARGREHWVAGIGSDLEDITGPDDVTLSGEQSR